MMDWPKNATPLPAPEPTNVRRFRLAFGLVVATLLSACATPMPVQRLDDAEFGRWTSTINTRAQQISAAHSAIDPQARLTLVFSELSDGLDKDPSEAAHVWRQWRDTSGNLTTLADYFLTRRLLLNYFFDTLGGDLLIPTQKDRYGLTLARDGLNAVFGEESSYIAPWIVDDPAFTTGTSYGLTPVINRARVKPLYELLRESVQGDIFSGKRLNEAALMQTVAANEVAHTTLVERFGFAVSSDGRLAGLKLALPGLKLKTARQAHEFISDAASIATHPAALYALTSNLMNSLTITDWGEMRVSGDAPYAPAASFFANSVTTVLNRLGRPPLFDDAFKRWKSAPETTKDAMTLRLTGELMASLGERGYNDLVNDYTDYARQIVAKLEDR